MADTGSGGTASRVAGTAKGPAGSGDAASAMACRSNVRPAASTIMCVVASRATGGTVMMTGGTQSGSSIPFTMTGCACNALPIRLMTLNRTSMSHGYRVPMRRVLNAHAAHVNASVEPSMMIGNIHASDTLMPQARPTARNASKLMMNASRASTTATVTPGHMRASRPPFTWPP